MADLSHFSFDLFLSYGWSGLSGAEDGDRGWVKEFKKILSDQLSAELGRAARVYLDVEQTKNGELPDNLRDAVINSALFLSVITPGSCRAGSWCHHELDWFTTEAAELLPSSRQLFSLLLRDVERESWPAALMQREIVPEDFLNNAAQRGPVPRSELADAATDGGGRVQTLAIKIANVLKHIEKQTARTVLLAYVEPSFRTQVERLLTEVAKQQGVAIDISYEPGELEDAFRFRLSRALKRASLFVPLLGAGESVTPPGWSASLERVQIEAANARFGQNSGAVMVWRQDSASGVSDWPNAQMPNGLGFEYLHSLLCQTLQSNVNRAEATAIVRQQAQDDAQARVEGSPKYIFIECVQRDLERLRPLRDALQTKGYRVKYPLFQGNAALRRQEDLHFLPRCVAAAVYFGSRDDLEAYLACQAMANAIKEHALSIPRAVLLDPPSDPVRSNFLFPDFTNYPFSSSNEFITSVTGGVA